MSCPQWQRACRPHRDLSESLESQQWFCQRCSSSASHSRSELHVHSLKRQKQIRTYRFVAYFVLCKYSVDITVCPLTDLLHAHQLPSGGGDDSLSRKTVLLQERHGKGLHLQQGRVLAVLHVHDLQHIPLPILALQSEILVEITWQVGHLGHTHSIQLLHQIGGLLQAKCWP